MSLEIDRRLATITGVANSLVVFPVANTAWGGPPLLIADVVLGRFGPAMRDVVKAAAKGRPILRADDAVDWTPESGATSGDVVFATWVPAFGEKARDLAYIKLDQLLGLCLLFRHDDDNLDLVPFRGESHRPGVRGLVLHRPTLSEVAMGDQRVSRELAAQTFVSSTIRRAATISWFGEKPFPLDVLLADPRIADVIERVLPGGDPTKGRFLVTARWCAKAHWANDMPDATLSLGIALDALIGDKAGLPMRVLADRFALAEVDKTKRAMRARRFVAFYGARSAVAHGGQPQEIEDVTFVREFLASVRWLAERILRLVEARSVTSNEQYAELFEAIKWGTLELA